MAKIPYTPVDDPDDLRAFLPYLIAYVSQKPKNRALTKRMLTMAKRLLCIQRGGAPDHRDNGRWSFMTNWQRRLELAGLDPVTFEVVDELRWALAWEQLRTELTFRQEDQLRKIVLGVRPIDLPAKAHAAPRRTIREETKVDLATQVAVSNYKAEKLAGYRNR